MSVNVPASEWNLQTPGGIPVKVVERSGSFSEEGASAKEVYIMRASDLLSFVEESFPAPTSIGGTVQYPRRRDLPGLGSLVTTRVSYESLVDGRPIDPFSTHSSAPSRTYDQFIRVTIDYGTRPENDQAADPNDPKTFLDVSSQARGEFLNQPIRGTAKWTDGTTASEEELKDIDVPNTVVETTTEWTFRWSQIPQDVWDDSIVGRLRDRLGKVNDSEFSLVGGAPAETVLLLGYNANTQFTWRQNRSGQSPIQVDVQFLEKNFTGPDGTEVTHNHFWNPDNRKYQILKIDGTNKDYKTADMDGLFLP